MCASLKALLKAEPRCPEVPNATRCAGNDGSGLPAKYAVTSRGMLASIDCGTVLPASGLIWAVTRFPSEIQSDQYRGKHKRFNAVIASAAKQSSLALPPNGLLRRFAPRNDDKYHLILLAAFLSLTPRPLCPFMS